MALFKVEEIAIIRETIPLDAVPKDLGIYIGEDVEILRVLEGEDGPPDEPGYEILALSDKRQMMCRQSALRKKTLPGEDDSNQEGSWDIIEEYLGFKVPELVKV